jgi:hypothetical protein
MEDTTMAREVLANRIFDVSEDKKGWVTAKGVEADVSDIEIRAKSRQVMLVLVAAGVSAVTSLEWKRYNPWS